MSCSNKPNYTPHTLSDLTPTKQWGIGRSFGYTRFDPNEFHALEDEVKITMPVGFEGKVSGSYRESTYETSQVADFSDVGENPIHEVYYLETPSVAMPSAFTDKFTAEQLQSLASTDLDGINIKATTAGNRMQVIIKTNIVATIERLTPELFSLHNAKTLAEKVAVVRTVIDGTIFTRVWGNGFAGTTTQVNWQILSSLQATAWSGGTLNNTSDIARMSYNSQTGTRVQDDGFIYTTLWTQVGTEDRLAEINFKYPSIEYEIKSSLLAAYRGNPNIAYGKSSQMNHENILRGSKYLALPTQLFNGAVLNERERFNGAVIARTQKSNQGLMFLWDDFFKPDRRVNIGDQVTFSVDVRSNGAAIPNGAVAFKSTPNFAQNYKVIETPVGNGFTRVSFQTTYLGDTWTKPSGWDAFWGVTNPPVNGTGLVNWNKDNLCGFIQAKDSIQLEFARPMVSAIGATAYRENSADFVGNNVWDWNKAQNKAYLDATGKLMKNGGVEDWTMPAFIPVDGTAEGHMILYKLNKKAFTMTGNRKGKIVFYSAANESSVVRIDSLESETGKYGGVLYTNYIPAAAKFYRINITADKNNTEIGAQTSYNNWQEFKQEWYDAVNNKLDGKTALAQGYLYREAAAMNFVFNLRGAVEKALPNIFNGLSKSEAVQRLREIAFRFDTTMIARGSSRGVPNATWQFREASGSYGTVHEFTGEGLTEYTHKSTYQEWILDDGTLRAYLRTTDENPAVGERPLLELDYYQTSLSIVVPSAQLEAWGFVEDDPKYLIESVTQPTSRTEDYMLNSAVQVTHAYNIYGMVNESFPEFFGDCYTFEDKINKLNARVSNLDVTFNPIITDLDVGGAGYVTVVAEASNEVFDFTDTAPKNIERRLMIDNSRGVYIQPNGYLYVGFARPAEDRNTELAVTGSLNITFTMDRRYDQLKRVFRLGGKKMPWFLRVRDIQRSVLPPKQNNLVSMRKGTTKYSFGTTEGDRYIILNCFIKAEKESDIPYLMEELADYLDVGETDLRFSDQPDRYYRVMLDGSTDLNQETHIANFNISFILLDNYAFGNEVVEEFQIDGMEEVPYITLNNAGTADTFPQYLLEFDEEVGYVDLIGTDTSANVSIGRRPVESISDEKINLRPRKFYTRFINSDGAGWRNITDGELPQFEGASVKIQGANQRANGMFYQDKWKYGDDTSGFHGNGATASLQKNLDNFYMEAVVAAYGKPKKNSLNTLFFVLYDETNTPYAYAKFGTRPSDGRLDAYVSSASQFTHSKVITKGKAWDSFQGKVMIECKNNRWKLSVGQFKNRKFSPAPESLFNFGQNMLKDVATTGWFNLPTDTWDKKFSRIGIFAGTWKDRPLKDHLSVRRVQVWENLEASFVEEPVGDPMVFNVGDSVIIDSNKSQVYLNGELKPALVDPMTDWFPVRKGENLIGVNNFKGKLSVIYPERFK